MILVTGAAGKTGRAVIVALSARGENVRAFVRRPEQREAVLAIGARQVIDGDMADQSAVERATDGVNAIYHICPNVDPREVEYAKRLMNAATSAGIGQFGYHSVLHPQTERMAHHWQKLRVEESLFESGLPFTIIQPCAYMQNLLGQKESILSRGLISIPYSTEAKLSMVDLTDVASAIAIIMSEPGHLGAIYELAGPAALSHAQIASTLSELLGRPVRAARIDAQSWADQARSNDLGQYAIEALTAMFAYYDRFGLVGNSNVLQYLLGRKPQTIESFVRRAILAS